MSKTKKGWWAHIRPSVLEKAGRPVVEHLPPRFEVPQLPAGVVPQGVSSAIAQDSSLGYMGDCVANANNYGIYPRFRGYAYLAQLSQISEFRSPSETIATEMTREWIKLVSTGDDDHSEQINALAAEMDRLKLRDVFKQAIEHDGFFGRGMIYIDVDQRGIDNTPLVLDPRTIKKGSLVGFKAIEPIWTTPSQYNSIDPTARDFYRPTGWYVMGREVHASRLMMMVARPLPDMLKAAYNFSGISMSQLIEPYVDSWLQTRKSVSDVIKAFSFNGLKTDMQTQLASSVGGDDGGGADDLFNRVDLYNRTRDNRGLMLLDKESEEFFQFNTPLSTLDALQAQSQEQMAAPCHIPLVKLLGITPSGLNASSEGEIEVFYDFVRAQQESMLTDALVLALKVMQLSLFGQIYDGISFEYQSLDQETPEQAATTQKTKVETGAALIDAGVISAEEERARIASDPDSGYNGLDADEVPSVKADNTESDPA
jgi:phage-related protein (TIGR01555 family)